MSRQLRFPKGTIKKAFSDLGAEVKENYKTYDIGYDFAKQPFPAVFLVVKRTASGDWPLFAGSLDSIADLSGLKIWQQLSEQGATHIHVRHEAETGRRTRMKSELIHRFTPPLNIGAAVSDLQKH